MQQRQSAQHIVVEILSRINHRFAHVRVGSEVHDRVHPFEHRRQLGGIRDVSYHQLETFRQLRMPGRQVVVNDGLIPSAFQSMGGVTSDVSRTSHDQDRQWKHLLDLLD
jgi:hypothetical protein